MERIDHTQEQTSALDEKIAIEVKHLSKNFGRVLAVRDISFTVRTGVVTGFVGPNGSGKSTTLRCIAGLSAPSSGEALVFGKKFAAHKNPLQVMGCLLDNSNGNASLSARQWLKSIAVTNGIPTSRVEEVLALTGLTSRAKQKIRGFSLGMRQRVTLAAALLGDPQILILDEPVNGLDPEGILWLRQFLTSYASRGRAVLISSHLLSELALVAQDLIVIGKGQMRYCGPIQDLLKAAENPGGKRINVRSLNNQALAAALSARGAQVSQNGETLQVSGLDEVEIGQSALAAGVVLTQLTTLEVDFENAVMQLVEDQHEYAFQKLEA